MWLLLLLAFLPFPSLADTVNLFWDEPTLNADGSCLLGQEEECSNDLSYYTIFRDSNYPVTKSSPILGAVSYPLETYVDPSPNLGDNYYAVSAHDNSGNDSELSNQVLVTIQGAVPPVGYFLKLTNTKQGAPPVTDTVRYLNTTSPNSAGGDGTTNELTGANRAYFTLAAWDTAEAGAIATGDRHILNVTAESGAELTERLNLSSWSTAGTAELILQRHASATAAIIKPSGAGHVIQTSPAGFTLDGLTIDGINVTGGSDEGIRLSESAAIKNCTFRDFIRADQDGIYSTDATTATYYIKNNFLYNIQRSAIHMQSVTNKTVILANNTAYNVDCGNNSNYTVFGFDGSSGSPSSTIEAYNNACFRDLGKNGSCYQEGSGSGTFSGSDNIANDATAEALFTNSYDSVTIQDVTTGSGERFMVQDLTAGSEDLHLIDHADNIAKGNGIGPSSESEVLTTDIDGDARSGTTCDIGADEIAAGVTLIINDGAHAHAADSLGLTQKHQLAVSDSGHSHLADNVVLQAGVDLVIQEAGHNHVADSVALTQKHQITLQDAVHSHTADNVALTQKHGLAVEDAVHGHTADSLALTQKHILVVADALHGHSAQNVVLQVSGTLDISQALHGHSADNITLTQAHTLEIAESAHAHAAQNVVLEVGGVLVIQDAFHTHSAPSIVLTQKHTINISDALHLHAADNLSLGTLLQIAATLHTHSADNVSLAQKHVLTIADSAHSHAADGIDLTQKHVLVISDALHAHLADQVALQYGELETSGERIFVVESENRIYVIAPDDGNRIFII